MKKYLVAIAMILVGVGCGGGDGGKPAATGARVAANVPDPARATADLAAPAAFATIADPAARSRALFAEAARAFAHPRCTNCHPADDAPRVGDLHRLHDPPVARGPRDRGTEALPCSACHKDASQPAYRMPGAPDWRLAPKAMALLDRTPAQICAQLKTGPRTPAQLADFIAHDVQTAWAWSPGDDRTPAPGSPAALAALVQAWAASGAACPQE